jgi:hypothetical protein
MITQTTTFQVEMNYSIPVKTLLNFKDVEGNQNSPCPAIINSNSINNPCLHLRLELERTISNCEKSLCCLCCVSGVILVIIGIIAFLFLLLKKGWGSSGNSYSMSTGSNLLFWQSHWLYRYGYTADFIEPRLASSSYSDSEIDSRCCDMKYPHDYKISCIDCKNVLKQGHDYGSLSQSVMVGICGLSIVIGVFLLII